MASKVLVTIAFGLFIQTISAQVIGNMYGPGIGPGIGPNLAAEAALAGLGPMGPGMPLYGPGPNVLPYEAPVLGCGFGLKLSELSANGGGFTVSSTSPLAPTGISVQSDNLAFEGPLAVSGIMPFLGSVAIEGPLPAVGQGEVSYGCGNGNVAIAEEITGPTVNTTPGPTGPGYNGMGPRQYGPMY